MSDRWLNILSGAGSIVRIWPTGSSLDPEFEQLLDEMIADRPSDYEAIMLDMRRAMIDCLDKLPSNEQARFKSRLRPEYRSSFERRLGIENRSGTRVDQSDQLEFGFAKT